MTPTLDAFRRQIALLGGDDSLWTYRNDPTPSLVLPALHDAVGPLTAEDDGIELTLEIGTKHHTHFSGDSYDGSSDADRMVSAAYDAARFVTEVLAERICITVDYLGERCIGSSHFYLDAKNTSADTVRDTAIGLKGGNIRSVRYLWTGPIDPGGG